MFDKLFKKEVQEPQKHESGFKKPEDYYGRFTLDEIDNCVDDIQLKKWSHEIQLDFDNNKIRFLQCQEINYKKRMNFCKFFIYRIHERLEEIKRIKALSHNASTRIRKSSPDRWQLMVNAIIERYPGVDLQHIINIIDKKY
ncbi:hypothetical protein [Sphingobacterium yanglingense]|uniref:Uncharacterized protein n=1 Tax=Sphingobacterium yanglingense TaxID=1437280 RepID=A0A4V3DE35_9SPHI|nr:hypothetical protein [Sphingobacterium yanglingense]TDQ79549.1 hypothetical protein CLV99_0992 [Sphingobacterium yanglingense]